MSNTITGYQLTKAFYSELEQNEVMQLNAKPHHLSLYTWICELRNRVNMEVVDLPRDYTMKMSLIGSPTTLRNCIRELAEWGIIEVLTVGKNDWTGSTKVKLSCSFLNSRCSAADQQAFSSRSTGVQQANTTKTSKTVKTSKTDIDTPATETKVAFRDNVKLAQGEFDKLVEKYGQPFVELCLDKLSSYKLSHGKKYDSDYGAINSWVIKAIQKDQAENGAKGKAAPAPPQKTRQTIV